MYVSNFVCDNSTIELFEMIPLYSENAYRHINIH